MVFCKIIGSIVFAFCPEQVELALRDAIFDPMVSHVEGLGSLHSDLRSKYIVCRGIVGFDWGTGDWLWVAKFDECSNDGASFLGS